MKKPQKYQPGTVALYKILWYQMNTELHVCKCPFVRLVHEIAQDCGHYDLHFQVQVVMALQEAVEYYLTGLLEDANLCVIHMKCISYAQRYSVSTLYLQRASALLNASSSLSLFQVSVGCRL